MKEASLRSPRVAQVRQSSRIDGRSRSGERSATEEGVPMKLLRRIAVTVILALAVVGMAGLLSAEEPTQDAEAVPVHKDSTQLLSAVEAGARAHVTEDLSAMLEALDRLEANTRELTDEDKSTLGSDLVVYDQAFFATVRKSRAFALEGSLDGSFNQFVWVQRACVVCHGIARKAGMQIEFPGKTP